MLGIDDEGPLAAGGTGGLCGAKDMFSMSCLPSLIIEAGNSTSYRLLIQHVTGVGHREGHKILHCFLQSFIKVMNKCLGQGYIFFVK